MTRLLHRLMQKKLGVEVIDSLERIFKEADYITVHVPKNEQTLNMIDAEQIKMMKPAVRLINCARGGIINEDALYDALAEKRIAGAALDVYSMEPPKIPASLSLKIALLRRILAPALRRHR